MSLNQSVYYILLNLLFIFANEVNSLNQKSNINTADKKNEKKTEKKKSPMTPIQVFLLNFLIVITVLWLLFGFVIGVATAPNSDMSQSIKAKDLLLYYRLDDSLHSQDVVMLSKNGTSYVGRIVATGGDSVDITDDGQLIVNGNRVSEPDIHNSTPRFEGFVNYPLQLGSNEFFVLADARGGAEDSRYYGSVNSSDILGKVVMVVRRNNI